MSACTPWASLKGTCRSPAGAIGVGVTLKRVTSYRGVVPTVSIHEEPLRTATDLLLADADGFAPHKPCTDVIVHGTVVAPPGARAHVASVSIAGVTKHVRVHGERRFSASARGVHIEQVAPLREARLSYEHAYGGTLAREKSKRRGFGASDDRAPPFDPRNPLGRGFALRDRVALLDGALVPAQEDPNDPITADRAVRANDEDDWKRGPVPASFGPVDWMWLPRAELLLLQQGGPDPRWLSCASPGLALPHLSGRQELRLHGLRWGRGDLRLVLDLAPPRARLEFPGVGGFDVAFHLATLVLDADDETVTEVWGGFQPTAMPYPEDQLALVRLTVAGQPTLQ